MRPKQKKCPWIQRWVINRIFWTWTFPFKGPEYLHLETFKYSKAHAFTKYLNVRSSPSKNNPLGLGHGAFNLPLRADSANAFNENGEFLFLQKPTNGSKLLHSHRNASAESALIGRIKVQRERDLLVFPSHSKTVIYWPAKRCWFLR